MSDQFLEPDSQETTGPSSDSDTDMREAEAQFPRKRIAILALVIVMTILAVATVTLYEPVPSDDPSEVFAVEEVGSVTQQEDATRESNDAVPETAGPNDQLDVDPSTVQGQRIEAQLSELTQAVTALGNQSSKTFTTLGSIQQSIQQLGEVARTQGTRLTEIEATVSTLQGELLSIRAAQKSNEFTEERRNSIANVVIQAVNQDLKGQLGINQLLARIAEQERELEQLRLQLQAIVQHSGTPEYSDTRGVKPRRSEAEIAYNNTYTDPSELPFEIVSIDIWDNTPSVTIQFSGKLAVITPGEQRMRWVLRNVDVARRVAVFQHLDSGDNVTMRAS